MHIAARRLFVALCTTACIAPAMAQTWPSRPIRLVVAYGAGSPPDVIARIYSEHLAKELGATVVVDNKAGASGNLASAEVAKAPGDGYTMLYNVSSAFTINPFVYTKMQFDAQKDLTPVATTMIQGYALVANSNTKIKDFGDLLSQAKSDPGKISYASWGIGSYSHVFTELLLDRTNGKMLHVPYRAAPLNEVMAGQVDILVEPMASATQFITAGRVKVFAYTGHKRHPAMPNVPAIAEQFPNLTLHAWHGVWAPSTTPADILNRFNAAMVRVSKDERVVKKIKDLGVEPLGATPEEMRRMIAQEQAVYGPWLKANNVKLD